MRHESTSVIGSSAAGPIFLTTAWLSCAERLPCSPATVPSRRLPPPRAYRSRKQRG